MRGNQWPKTIEGVIERYPEFILGETLRSFLGTVVGDEYNSVLAHGRQLDNNPLAILKRVKVGTHSIRIATYQKVQVREEEKWTIEGSDNPGYSQEKEQSFSCGRAGR